MALTLLTTKLSALTSQSAPEDDDPIDMDELEELEDYLSSLELEIKVENCQSTFHCFLHLPAELRGLIYEQIAYATTIQLDEIGNWRHWPAICFASRQTYYEALSIVYRCAAFEASMPSVNCEQIINFVESLPPVCLAALSANERLTVFFGGVHGAYRYEAIEIYALLQPWLSLCWSLADSGNDVRWFYKASMPAGLERKHPFLMYPANDERRRFDELQKSGYLELKEVYAMVQDERMKDEVAGMLLALQTSARYCNLLVRAEVDLQNQCFLNLMMRRLH